MNKQQAFEYIRKKIGFVPYVGVFDIFNETEDIPSELIQLSIVPLKPHGNFIITSSKVSDVLKDLLNS